MLRYLPAVVLALAGWQAEAANQWVLDHFSIWPSFSGPSQGVAQVPAPAIVNGATVTGGHYGLDIIDDPSAVPQYTYLEVAIVDTTVSQQDPSGQQYAAAVLVEWNRNQFFNSYWSNVTLQPCFGEWQNYGTTNWDAITHDAGVGYGNMFVDGLTITCPDPSKSNWADAAIDFKGAYLQLVAANINGHGLNTLKLWKPGPHYIVNSTINNSRWLNADPIDDGGLVSTSDCSQLTLIIWNSTFNGSPTLDPNKIACWDVAGTPNIIYATQDPRTTGEMHPMLQP